MLDGRRKTQVIDAVRKAARDCILPRFRQLSVADVSTKSGPGDLVTLADTEAEAQITAEIGALWPEAVVLGEEAVAADPANRDRMAQADWAVIIDPVDGTWNYAKGLATFGVILSVCHRGQPVFAMLYDPLMDDWIEASPGQGARAPRGPAGRRVDAACPSTRARRARSAAPSPPGGRARCGGQAGHPCWHHPRVWTGGIPPGGTDDCRSGRWYEPQR